MLIGMNLDECELVELKPMPMLREFRLKDRRFLWNHKDVFNFIRNQPKLELIDIKSDRNNVRMKFDKKFTEMFDKLLKKRPKFMIKVQFQEGDRKMTISQNGFKETREYEFLHNSHNNDQAMR